MRTLSVSAVVAHQLGKLRYRRAWSQQELADAVTDQGGNLTRAAIAKIETCRRAVSLDELFLLAAALKVPPPMLLLPFDGDELVQVTPHLQAQPHALIEWFFGEEALLGTDSTPVERRGWLEGAEPLRMDRELASLFGRVVDTHGDLAEAEYLQDAEQIKAAQYLYVAALKDLHAHLMAIIKRGGRQRPIHAAWVADMKRLDLDTSALDVLPEQ